MPAYSPEETMMSAEIRNFYAVFREHFEQVAGFYVD